MSNWQQSENTKTIGTILKEMNSMPNPYELLEKAIKELESRVKKLEDKQNYDLK